jgi:hypothetical protein
MKSAMKPGEGNGISLGRAHIFFRLGCAKEPAGLKDGEGQREWSSGRPLRADRPPAFLRAARNALSLPPDGSSSVGKHKISLGGVCQTFFGGAL